MKFDMKLIIFFDLNIIFNIVNNFMNQDIIFRDDMTEPLSWRNVTVWLAPNQTKTLWPIPHTRPVCLNNQFTLKLCTIDNYFAFRKFYFHPIGGLGGLGPTSQCPCWAKISTSGHHDKFFRVLIYMSHDIGGIQYQLFKYVRIMPGGPSLP
jgi:hypothetical protein